MPFIQRDSNNKIIGRYANKQNGYAEEYLPDDAQELLPTLEDVTEDFEKGIQKHLDVEAKSKGYDNILSACTYAYPNNPFQSEATSFVIWRSAVWAYCYGELEKVKTGARTMPTLEQIISELPTRSA